MSKLKKRGTQWRPKARRIETAMEASYFAPRFDLTREQAVAIIKDAVPSTSMERTDAPPKRL